MVYAVRSCLDHRNKVGTVKAIFYVSSRVALDMKEHRPPTTARRLRCLDVLAVRVHRLLRLGPVDLSGCSYMSASRHKQKAQLNHLLALLATRTAIIEPLVDSLIDGLHDGLKVVLGVQASALTLLS